MRVLSASLFLGCLLLAGGSALADGKEGSFPSARSEASDIHQSHLPSSRSAAKKVGYVLLPDAIGPRICFPIGGTEVCI